MTAQLNQQQKLLHAFKEQFNLPAVAV